MNPYLDRIDKYQALSKEEMEFWKQDFLDDVFSPYLIWLFENRKKLDNVNFFLFRHEVVDDESLRLAEKMKEENSVIWLDTSEFEGVLVMHGWIVNENMRRAFALEIINAWIGDK